MSTTIGSVWVNKPGMVVSDTIALTGGIRGDSSTDSHGAQITNCKAISTDGSQALTPGTNPNSNEWLITYTDCGPAGDNCILLFPENKDHLLTNVSMHDSAQSRQSFGQHGVYDKSPGTVLVSCESWAHPNGSCYSHRFPNVNYRSKSHDSGAALSLFDYSFDGTDGHGNDTLLIREHIGWNMGWFFYSGGDWSDTTTGAVRGPSKIKVEIDHCTFDCRSCTTVPCNFYDHHTECWLTNSVLIVPNSHSWQPWWKQADASILHTDATVVLNETDARTYLKDIDNHDYTPLPISNSPLIGKAVNSSPRSMKMYGNLSDIGAIQSTSFPPPVSKPTAADVWTAFEQATIFRNWQHANPVEAQAVKQYWLNGGTPPVPRTAFGKALVLDYQHAFSDFSEH